MSLSLGIPFSLIGNASLIVAAAYTKATTQRRINVIFIYLGTHVLLLFLVVLRFAGSFSGHYSGHGHYYYTFVNLLVFYLAIPINVFFMLVAFSFYRELKIQDAKPQDKAEKETECKV
jgi:hypothetical protein